MHITHNASHRRYNKTHNLLSDRTLGAIADDKGETQNLFCEGGLSRIRDRAQNNPHDKEPTI